MDNFAGLIGIVIAIGVRQYIWNAEHSWSKKLLNTILIMLAAAIGAGGATYSVKRVRYELNKSDNLERAMAQFRSAALIGAVLRDNPSADAALKDALRLDIEDRTNHRGRAKVSEMRKTYVSPAMMGANAQLVVDSWKSQSELMIYLQGSNQKLCREFFENGLSNLNDLDEAGRRLFETVMKKLESVYMDGKGKPPASSALTDTDWAKLLEILELSNAESDILSSTAGASDRQVCDVGTKFYSGILSKLHVNNQPRVVRAILANS